MLTIQEMTCTHCSRSQETEIICRVGKDGLVRFFVECNLCGCHSHQLEYNEINIAVRHMLLASGYPATSTIVQQNIRRRKAK